MTEKNDEGAAPPNAPPPKSKRKRQAPPAPLPPAPTEPVITEHPPMEIHKPKPFHNFREFLGEIGIIVIGVLIALGAEQFIDAMHWREKIDRSEAAMRLELAEDDGPQAFGRVIVAGCLDAQLKRIHDGIGSASAAQLRQWTTDYSPPFRIWDSEAWQTVLASDVGSHMGPDRLVQWSSPYRLMPAMTDSNVRERDLAAELREGVPATGEPSPIDLQNVRRLSGQLRAINWMLYRSSQLVLSRARAVAATVPETAQRDLFAEAKTMYGSCVARPDPRATPIAQTLGANLRLLPLRFGN